MKQYLSTIRSGDIILNPISGETFIFRKTSAETNGGLLKFECIVVPGGRVALPKEHIHPQQTEIFIIHEGSIRTVLNSVERTWEAGATVLIPKGTPHISFNASQDQPLRFTTKLEPAGAWKRIFASMFAFARDGRTAPDGTPPLLQIAATLHAYPDYFYRAGPPVWLQKWLFATLSPVAKLKGYQVDYPYFPAPAISARSV